MMTFKDFLDGDFVGQKHVISQLEVLGKELANGNNLNIILAANSGHGKTTLGNAFVKWVDPAYYDTSIAYNGDIKAIRKDRRIHVLDEAHMIEHPEFLYPLMDSGKYVFMILTNEYYDLKEPFYNRCHDFTFTEYSEEELIEISRRVFEDKGMPMNMLFLKYIVQNLARGMPRVLKNVSKRLAFYFSQTSLPSNMEEFSDRVDSFLHVEKGFTILDRQYINFLRSSSNRQASLSLIANSTKIDKSLIVEDIEPYLASKGLISITSRGRRYIGV